VVEINLISTRKKWEDVLGRIDVRIGITIAIPIILVLLAVTHIGHIILIGSFFIGILSYMGWGLWTVVNMILDDNGFRRKNK